ncbi:Osmotin thaumatin-like protein [Armillaria borealis]|uniref:Osmotin thaumatin-like protein n=1 Tax=Armillaria borealis TaxID=47425 RepID=A0AA39MSV9_9AGAR|nr:Osmotin thaumatin-like protein [Armillaria borealis]
MKNIALSFGFLVALASSASAFTITFKNNCGYTVWPAVGKAPNGVPDTSVSFGTTLGPGASASFGVDDHALGIRAWGRTGCNSNGANCATGGCNGGLVCTGRWHYLRRDPLRVRIRKLWTVWRRQNLLGFEPLLSSSDGTSVTCTQSSCPDDQAYSYATDYAADRNSALGQTYTHTFCP